MRLRDYFRGYPLEMQSPLRRDELERRINKATISGWKPLAKGVSGWAHFGRIRLRYRQRFIQYDGSPILAGRIDDSSGLSRLRLRYRAPLPLYPFFVFWYAFLLLIALNLLSQGFSPGVDATVKALAVGIILLFLLIPIGMHYVLTRHADSHFDAIVKFLEEVAEARVMSGFRRPTV